MFVKPILDPSGNGVQRELIAVNSTLTLVVVRPIRNRSIRVVHRFHSSGKPRLGASGPS